MLSMALCWLLGDPDRRAPKGLQYLVLLWQEDLTMPAPAQRIISGLAPNVGLWS